MSKSEMMAQKWRDANAPMHVASIARILSKAEVEVRWVAKIATSKLAARIDEISLLIALLHAALHDNSLQADLSSCERGQVLSERLHRWELARSSQLIGARFPQTLMVRFEISFRSLPGADTYPTLTDLPRWGHFSDDKQSRPRKN